METAHIKVVPYYLLFQMVQLLLWGPSFTTTLQAVGECLQTSRHLLCKQQVTTCCNRKVVSGAAPRPSKIVSERCCINKLGEKTRDQMATSRLQQTTHQLVRESLANGCYWGSLTGLIVEHKHTSVLSNLLFFLATCGSGHQLISTPESVGHWKHSGQPKPYNSPVSVFLHSLCIIFDYIRNVFCPRRKFG